MRKTIITLGFIAAGFAGTIACSGPASADPIVIVNESNTSSSGSVSCVSAEVAAQLPSWLRVPVCP